MKTLRHSIVCRTARPRRRPSASVALLVGTFLVLLCGLSACGSTDAPGGAGASAQSAPSAGSSPGAQSVSVDMDAIFPPGEGRDLVLANCQSCHIWVPIVILQMNETEWARNKLEHRGRVEALSDEDFDTLYEYLMTTFTPDRPVPDLPPALLEAWTTY